jgi:glycosyltransferase involved in cell wall biosynthesis
LTALVESADHVCCRYRLASFQAHWERAGHALTLCRWPRHWWSWPGLLRNLRYADAVIVQRKLPPNWQLHLLRRAARRLLFDFDDAVYCRDSFASKGTRSARRLRRFTDFCRAADSVIAGNAFLASEAKRASPHGPVSIIPTCVDPNRYPIARHARVGSGVQLVWVGSSSTLQGLEAISPLLEGLGERWPGLCLKFVCDRFLTLMRLPILPVRWTESGEAAEIADADIGISWMPDDAWSRGKCGLKVLQYMAAGLPVVANPVGVHCEMVRHGENGFLAESAGDWQEAMGRLAHDPSLRRRMGTAGRQRIENDYAVSVGAARWLEVLERLKQERAAA